VTFLQQKIQDPGKIVLEGVIAIFAIDRMKNFDK
jgi:hypothetical protein